MAPKKDAGVVKKTDKAVVDKTFGMKNKKGGVGQRQIAQMKQAAAASKNPDDKRKETEKLQKEKERKAVEDAKREINDLFKTVQVQKVPIGVDPKTIVCQFFKKGTCDKGKKCKFSHDLSVERKAVKKDLYQDVRDGEGEGEELQRDTMEDWDEQMLRDVVTSKHGNPQTTTDKVCKFFIDAVENQKYGWFWTCPNGGDACKYKHSLPAGFVLKTREQRALEKAEMEKNPMMSLTMEAFLDSERHKLTGKGTPVTGESFSKWKTERLGKREAEALARVAKEATGRALFEKGDWKGGSGEEEDSEEEMEDEKGAWDLDALRRETEMIREEKESKRIADGLGMDDGGGAGG